MAILKMGNKTLFTQSGDDEPVINSDVINQGLSVATFPAGMPVNIQHYNSGYGSDARTTKTTQSWETLKIGGTNLTGSRKSTDNNVLKFTKKYNNSNLQIQMNIPLYLTNGAAGVGIRCKISTNGKTFLIVDILDNGPGHSWGAQGYGGNDASIINFTWNTSDKSNIESTIKTYTGAVYVFFEVYVWNSADTAYFIDYDDTYPKYGTFQIMEIMAGT